MACRRAEGLAIALVLVLGCTGSNPAFDHGTGGLDGGADDGASTDRVDTSDDGSEGLSAGPSDDTLTDGTSDGGSTCSEAATVAIGQAIPMHGVGCPSGGFIRGPVKDLATDSFMVADCGDCSECTFDAPLWMFTIPMPLLPESLAVDDCVEVHFDCGTIDFTLRNFALVRGSPTPAVVMAAPALPQSLGGWSPSVGGGSACPTDACPDNDEMTLEFVQESFGEGEAGRGTVLIHDEPLELDISVANAHYDPRTCDAIIRWIGKSG